MLFRHSRLLFLLFGFVTAASAAPDRITGEIDPASTVPLAGHRHSDAVAQNDLGPADASLPIEYATVYLQPGAGLEAFLADQQSRSSPDYHHWLTPEQFGDRFGVGAGDIRKIVGWLQSEGLVVHDVARGRHWVTFSGTAAQVGRAFHTEIHRYSVNGQSHFANSTDLSIPAALKSVVSGIGGLTDFHLEPPSRAFPPIAPDFNSVGLHFLAPDDIAEIYDIAPLYQQGVDGTGQTLAILGQVTLTRANIRDLSAFRQQFGLTPNVPQTMLFGTAPPSDTGDTGEAQLDLEISGAVARNANIIYAYSSDVFTSAQYAIDQNVAPVLSLSYGGCELDASPALRAVAQQANAQGITWMIASGDAGAATCDRSSPTPQASKGVSVSFPASLPEVTAVGGTEFNEDSGIYWAPTNTATNASALSYIPERVWNDTPQLNELAAAGGGTSVLFTKPIWQTAPGVPSDGARDVPDVSFAASAAHDGYALILQGFRVSAGGTSASTPLFAGVVALLNQATSSQGLGNINPVLYRLAQSTTDVFHDVSVGDNDVPCAQGSPNCVNGKLGFAATTGYDLASGLGSADVARLIAEWSAGSASSTTLTLNPSPVSYDNPVQLTATVSGSGSVPTGTVTFITTDAASSDPSTPSVFDTTLGVVTLTPAANAATASITLAGSSIAAAPNVAAVYSGDSNYTGSGASAPVALQLPTSGSYVVPFVAPNPVVQAGSIWPYTLNLRELAGQNTTLTAFTIDGVNNLPALPNTAINANSTVAVDLYGYGLTPPVSRHFHFEGNDGAATWQRDLIVPFVAAPPSSSEPTPGISLTLSPSVAQQNPQGGLSCQWSQQATIQELGGYEVNLTLFEGGTSLTNSISELFGTTRLAPRGLLTGTICYPATILPLPIPWLVGGVSEVGSLVTATAIPSLTSAPVGSVSALSLSTPMVSMGVGDNTQTATSPVNLNFDSGSPSWTATVFPAGETWLTVSPLSGTGPATLQLSASGKGLSNGVYNAIVSISASNSNPQTIQETVAFAVGASSAISIAGVGNAASGSQTFAPGQLLAVYGTNLAPANVSASIQPLPLSIGEVSATVNGVTAPLWFVSPQQINLQIPYETSAGTAVLGILNAGQAASFPFTVTPTGPGIFASADGSLVPTSTAAAGATIAMYITGDGDVMPTLATGASPAFGIPLSLYPHSRQPPIVTVGGENAVVAFNGITPGLIGVTQVNFTVPADLPAGPQPIVITVGGVASAPVNLTVTAPAQ